jgi:hypothetical protein
MTFSRKKFDQKEIAGKLKFGKLAVKLGQVKRKIPRKKGWGKLESFEKLFFPRNFEEFFQWKVIFYGKNEQKSPKNEPQMSIS